VIAAFAWAFGAASSLLVGAVIALRWRVGAHALGLTMAFGAGVLISAVAYDLVAEAFFVSADRLAIGLGLAAGAVTFYVGDAYIDQMGGADRKRTAPSRQAAVPARDGSNGGEDGGSSLAIVLGIVLDGIPESIVIGLTLIGGGVINFSVVAAVFLSNVPESVAATTGLRARGWSSSRILGLWVVVAVVSGLAGLGGYVLLQDASPSAVALVDAFAAGAIITMLADTMMPEAFEHARLQAGLATTLGFGLAFALTIAN
jgi:ZIP family zinc transporter